ncbi:LuxR C-terminal-related transcriptional regulator [Nonomuraea endophytica]|uniref:DNA-binding NarL/FixJ family response regulator n=1 Tax=Nonomuraea endophytica TaxID=714136 RepID=A0A7W8A5K1_9ACTN|nr:response regulator transcription factor [Nonomuraea endophytica]MBB5079101.1 DNA-binding NarL/FixJ family response regulator [Nonomuraea endophytica]
MRIVIAEDSAVLRDGLSLLLTSRGHQVLAAVGDGDALEGAVDEHRPDLAVVDVRMPPTYTDEGLLAAIRIRAGHPDLGVLVFSQYIETRYTAQLLAGDARGVGYLLKDRVADTEDFLAALDRLAAGQTVLDPEAVTQIIGAARRTEELDTLTPREREVLALMAEGRSNSAIAEALFLSYGSVEKHVTQIFTKLALPPSDTDHRRVLAVLRYLHT